MNRRVTSQSTFLIFGMQNIQSCERERGNKQYKLSKEIELTFE